MAKSSAIVIADTRDVDVNCAIEDTPEIHHIRVDHADQHKQVTVTLVERIKLMQTVYVNVKNMSLELDVISVLHLRST